MIPVMQIAHFLTKRGKKRKNFLDPASDANREKKNPGPASFAVLESQV